MRKIVTVGVALAVLAVGFPTAAVAQSRPPEWDEIDKMRNRRDELEFGLFAGGVLVFGTTPGLPAKLFHFDKSDVGKLPAGWQTAHTGAGEGSVWKVVADKTTPSKSGYALAQTAESPGAYRCRSRTS